MNDICPPHDWSLPPAGSGLQTYGARCKRCPAVQDMPGAFVRQKYNGWQDARPAVPPEALRIAPRRFQQ